MALNYTEIFGDDFDDVLRALEKFSPEAETMLLGIVDRMVYDTRLFSTELQKTVQTMLSNGMAQDVIKQTLNNDMRTGGAIFGKLQNDLKANIIEATNQSGRMAQYEEYFKEYDEKSLFRWVTVTGHKICPDCQSLSGVEALTFEQWESMGLPASGHTVCRGYCYCVLDPVGKMDKEVKVQPEKNPYKPTMTLKEATRWSSGSKVDGILYHGSSVEALESIGKNGFDLSKKVTGRMYGNGAYFTKSTEVASGYGGGSFGSFMVRSTKPMEILSSEFWNFQVGRVDNAAKLTRGHKFIHEIRNGINKKQTIRDYERHGYATQYDSVEDVIEARTKMYGKMDKTVEKDFLIEGMANPELRQGRPNYSGDWFDFLEDRWLASDPRAEELMDLLSDTGNFDDWYRSEGYGDLMTEFLQQKYGHTSLEVRHAMLPYGFQDINPNLTTDTYFIIFDEKNIVKIQD